MKHAGAPPLRRSSMIWRTVALAAAWLWAGGMVGLYFGYHIAQPGSPFLESGGHTYDTHPPALTLSQQDHVSAEIVAIALGLTLAVGTIDLVARLARQMTGPGVAAIVSGGTLMLFSLFGLLRGLAGIGTAGLLVILSGLPMRSAATPVPSAVTGSEPPPAW